MRGSDDNTPVDVSLSDVQIEQLKVQIGELREYRDRWLPVIEAARVLARRWDEDTECTYVVSDAMDRLVRMVEAAELAQWGDIE